ncbi:uncharacterized protein LOC124935794 [Impatiens glandulifera]|uniref:uncharacterized protein LOC124935794 n=1 Tax=Impatiens glandulifera TaxID=253017 RepID=UPI001FB04E7A|nr:uncharacterized protein LOC124935794 [Impatiens glandulifera]
MEGFEKGSRSKCKGKGDCENGSSLDVNEGHGTKGTNVVARLMGLDSLPSFASTEVSPRLPFSSPISVKGSRSQKRTNNNQIERCLSENFPPKFAKSISVPKHRHLCPAKAPGYVLKNDVASVPLQIQNLKQKLEASRKPRGFSVPSETPKCPRSYKYVKGQNKEMLGVGLGIPLASRTLHSSSSDNFDDYKTTSKGGKSVSLAIQAMINVRQRARLKSSEASDGGKLDQLNDSQINIHEGAQRPPFSVCKNRDVLGPNHQKQNCIASKDNVGSASPLSKQKDQKAPNLNLTLKTNSAVVLRKPQLSRQTVARKDTIRKSEMSVKRRNVSTDGDIKWDVNNRRNKTDIVSFTFSSPIKKTMNHGSVFSNQVMENDDDVNESGDSTSTTSGSNLSLVLEQKLDELSSRVKTSHFTLFEAQNNSSLSGLQDSPTKIYKQQVYEETEGNSCDSTDLKYERELAGGYNSPVSCLDPPSFSDGSCDSSNNKTTENSSNISEEIGDLIDPRPPQTNEIDLELSDSASSSFYPFTTNKKDDNWELEYIEKILDYAKLNLEDLVMNKGRRLIRPDLFFQLENQEIESTSEDLDKLFQRKVWFDCVGECIEEKAILLCYGTSKAWSKWSTLFENNSSLARDLYREISGWIGLGDLDTDELVDKDMSSWNGKWISNEKELFEVRLEIERRILSSLVIQLVADLYQI